MEIWAKCLHYNRSTQIDNKVCELIFQWEGEGSQIILSMKHITDTIEQPTAGTCIIFWTRKYD